MKIKNFENFDIVNMGFKNSNNEKHKYEIYGEYIVNKFFKDENFATDVEIQIYNNIFTIVIELHTMNLTSQTLILISKYCEFVNKNGNYEFYVEGHGEVGEDSVFGIKSSINLDSIEQIIKADKYNI